MDLAWETAGKTQGGVDCPLAPGDRGKALANVASRRPSQLPSTGEQVAGAPCGKLGAGRLPQCWVRAALQEHVGPWGRA